MHTAVWMTLVVGFVVALAASVFQWRRMTPRQRSVEAMKQKARRGELFLTVAVGM